MAAKNKTTATSNISNIQIWSVRNPDASRVKAMAKVEINGVEISGCRIIEGKNGLFFSLPQERKQGTDDFFPIVRVSDEVFKAANEMVVAQFKEMANAQA